MVNDCIPLALLLFWAGLRLGAVLFYRQSAWRDQPIDEWRRARLSATKAWK